MALLAALAVGLGLVVAFDGLTRPADVSIQVPFKRAAGTLAPALVTGAAAYAVTRWWVSALAGASLGLLLPRIAAEHRATRRRIEVTDALAEAAAALRDAVRGGLGLQDGLASIASWGPPTLREEFSALAFEARRVGVASAARGFAQRMADPGADLLAATLCFNDRVGGRQLADVLNAMAEELAAEAQVIKELRARQARQRASARIVAAAPVLLLVALRQVNPGYLHAYDSPAGQMVLIAAGLLIACGYALMVRIAKVAEPPRVFTERVG